VLVLPLGPPFPFAVFTAAILLSVWRGGAPSGLLATGLAIILLSLLHLWELSAGVAEDGFLPRLGLLLLVGLLACYLSRLGEEATRASDRLQATLSAAGHALIFTDQGGRLTFANSLAESLTGWKQSEALGQPLDEVCVLVNAVTREPLKLSPDGLLQGEDRAELADPVLLLDRQGQQVPVEGAVVPVRGEGGQVVGFTLSLQAVPPSRLAKQNEWLREREELLRRVQDGEAALQAQQKLLAESEATHRLAEESLASTRESHRLQLEQQSAEWERNTANWKEALARLEKQLRERVAAQQQAEETQQQARGELERQLAEKEAQLQQARVDLERERAAKAAHVQQDEKKRRQTEEDLRRQVQELQAAAGRSEQALKKAQEELERRHAAQEAARKECEEWQGQLAERSAAQQRAEAALQTARADLERQLTERTAALRAMEETLQKLRQEAGQKRQEEEALRQARLEWERERTDLVERLRNADQKVHEQGAARQRAEEAVGHSRLEWERERAELLERIWRSDAASGAHQEEFTRDRAKHAEASEAARVLQTALQEQVEALRRERDSLKQALEEERRAPRPNSQPPPNTAATREAGSAPEPADWLSYN
jgi:PAS domain S-box-containing protein